MSAKPTLRVMIAGGGTGGHVYPGIAMYRSLCARVSDLEVLFVGAKRGVEAHIFREEQLPHVLLSGRGLRGAGIIGKLTGPFLLAAGVVSALREVLAFRPDVVIGTGGFASVSAVVAAFLCRRTCVLQEQNSVPGMSNRWLARLADLVLIAYEESRGYFPARVATALVGNPLRMQHPSTREEALAFFNMKSDVPNIMIFGGSRGARAINDAAIGAIPRIVAKRLAQFVVLTGEQDYERVCAALAEAGEPVCVMPFLDRMDLAYGFADIAVARSGASAVFELATFGVPAVFVPYPYAADDHQRRNVAELDRLGATVVIDNADLTADKLEAILLELLGDGPRRHEMSRRMKEWAPTGAADRAAQQVLSVVNHRIRYEATCIAGAR